MSMKALFIGGTGTISTAISKLLLNQGCELYLLNRGTRNNILGQGIIELRADIRDEESVSNLIEKLSFDVVADFIAFEPAHVERDLRLFRGKTKQYIFISSCSAYQKPVSRYPITESTPLVNPYAPYSSNKAACENILTEHYKNDGFPVTIVRPSYTYDNRGLPLSIHGKRGSWQTLKRIKEGKPIIIQGDGTSLWTFTHTDDFAKGFVGLMCNPHAIGEAVHITSDEIMTWNQAYKIIADTVGVKLNPVYIASDFIVKAGRKFGYEFEGSLVGDKANSVLFDNTKIKRLVPGFVATTRFDTGIKRTILHMMSHPECQIEDTDFDKFCDTMFDVMERALNLL